MNRLIQFDSKLRSNMSQLIREETWEGKEYWVIPTIMMTEGVHNGLLYTAEQLKKSAVGWNGAPVVVWHPAKNGVPVTANDPDTLTETKVGTIFNASFEDGKLKAEAWVEKGKAQSVSEALVTMLQNDQPIEVSTGVYVDEDGEPGVWNEEEYRATAINHRPDHLALLPGGKGACSWEDGAGAPRINQEINQSIEDRKKMWLDLRSVFRANQLSHSDLHREISALIPKESWITEIYDGFFVFEVATNKNYKYFKQAYVVTDNDVKRVDSPIEVELKREFVPVANQSDGNQSPTTINKKGEGMGR